jgi:hypothetical protein
MPMSLPSLQHKNSNQVKSIINRLEDFTVLLEPNIPLEINIRIAVRNKSKKMIKEIVKRELALTDSKIHKSLSNSILSDKIHSNDTLRRFCFNLRNKVLVGVFEVSSYAKGKEETQFSNKKNVSSK